jgi:hypothetical protein
MGSAVMDQPKLDKQGRTQKQRRKLVWCKKHKQVGLHCKSKKCRKRHPGINKSERKERNAAASAV